MDRIQTRLDAAGVAHLAVCRAEWLKQLPETGVRRRAERLYQQLEVLQPLRHEVRRDLLAESRKHRARRLLRQIPCIGPMRAALLIAMIQTPHRFRTKRQLWAYCGLALETRTRHRFRIGGAVRAGVDSQCVAAPLLF
jgi:transposase